MSLSSQGLGVEAELTESSLAGACAHRAHAPIIFDDMVQCNATNTRRNSYGGNKNLSRLLRDDVETKRSHSRGVRARTLSSVQEVHACVGTVSSLSLTARHITSHITTTSRQEWGQE